MSHDDDYLDYMRDEALDDLFAEHTLEYKNQLVQDALQKTADKVDVIRGLLAEARAVLPASPTAALVFAASACEISLRELFLVPILAGFVHEEFATTVIVKLLGRLTHDKMAAPLTVLLKKSTFINLEETRRSPERKPILNEVHRIAEKRNKILHNGERADEASAKEAFLIADYLLNDTFRGLLRLHRLALVPAERDWTAKDLATVVPFYYQPVEDPNKPS